MRRSGGRTIEEIRTRIREEASLYRRGAKRLRQPRPKIPGPLRVVIPRGSDPYMTLAQLADWYGITKGEAVRRAKAGLLPWPIRDGRDPPHRRWLFREVRTLHAWWKSKAALSKQKYRVQTASTDAGLSGSWGKVLLFERPKPMSFIDFVRSLKITRNSRGDFIGDTMMLIDIGKFPEPQSWDALYCFMRSREHTCPEAIEAGRKVWLQYQNTKTLEDILA